MKTLKLLSFLFLSTLVLTSCGDDDGDNVSANEEDVVGNYMMTEYRTENARSDNNGVSLEYVSTGENFDFEIDFSASNELSSAGSFDIVNDITFMGDTQTITSSVNSSQLGFSGSWSVQGDQLVINNPDNGEISSTITVLTETMLQFRSNLAQVNGNPVLGGATAEGDLIITLVRQ